MDRNEIERRVRQGNFRENNGSVLRMINILRYKYKKLKEIKYALPDISEAEIHDSVNFLAEEEYIELRHTVTKAPANIADVPFEDIEAKLTGKGIRLLGGGIKDDMVLI